MDSSETKETKDTSILGLFRRMFEVIFRVKIHRDTDTVQDSFHLEPKYWPEVKHFIDELNHAIEAHTIHDGNIAQINQRIVDYVEDQINHKGQIEDIEERYSALNTLADRILSNSFNKIAGLKHSENTNTDFSDIIKNFKVNLEKRHREEVEYYKSKRA